MFSYQVLSSFTSQFGQPLSVDVETSIGGGHLLIAVRTSFLADDRVSRTFSLVPRHYKVGVCHAMMDGYVVADSFLEYERQLHFYGYNNDSLAEPSYMYPDTSSIEREHSNFEVGKITDIKGDNTFLYEINTGDLSFAGIPIEQSGQAPSPLTTVTAYGRNVLKQKSRLYSQAIAFNEFTVEVFTEGIIVNVQLLGIR